MGVAGGGGVGLEVREKDVWEGFGGAGRGWVGEGGEEVGVPSVCTCILSVNVFSFLLFLFLSLFCWGKGKWEEEEGVYVPMNMSHARKYAGETRNTRRVYPVPGDVHCRRALMSP